MSDHNQFILGKTIGQGTFGKVKIATHITTGEKVAIKILEKVKILEESDKIRVDREIKILKSLMHKNLIQIYSVIEKPTEMYLIMEYVNGGELFEYICLKQKLTEIEACKFYQDIISGIEYLHKQGIVHRDLKPENLLLTSKREIKIVDFGLSNIYRKGELLKTPCGSPCYAAPEMILGRRYNGLYVDIWSSGIILYAMVFGFLPFDEPDTDVLYKKITEGKYSMPHNSSDRFKDFIRRILTTDPSKRIGLDGIKTHPWFNLITPKFFQGIFIKKYIIPVDESILDEMEIFNYKKEEVRSLILANRHNHITTTYYLILKKKTRLGKTSVSDLSSEEYIRYINDPKNLKENKKKQITTNNNNNANSTENQQLIHSLQSTIKSGSNPNDTNEKADSSGTNRQTINSNQLNVNSNSNYNPDYHNIYEDTATNLRISLDNKNEANINQENLNNLKVDIESGGLSSTKQNETKKIYFPETEEIKTESNKICITSLNINFTDTEKNQENNNNNDKTKSNLIEKFENEKNKFDINKDNKDNNNNIRNNNNLIKEKIDNSNDIIDNYAENISMPDYLPTEINYNIVTSTQEDKNSNHDTDINYANNLIATDNLQENENDEYKGYGDYVLKTEFEDMRVSSSLKKDNNINNTDVYENINSCESSFEPLQINDLNSTIIKKNNIRNNNSHEKTQINNNLINTVKNNKNNNININTLIKKTVNFNLSINNRNDNDNKNLKKNEQNNYSENFLNTETSVKSTSIKSKKDYSLGKNTHVRDHYKQNLNQNPISNISKNHYTNYIRNIDVTKTNRFKKGFFNTSVVYEKSNDIRNKTFDGKFGSSSKSKEKPIMSNDKKINLKTYKEKHKTNYNNVNLYHTGYKENLRKINLNILNTDNSCDDNNNNTLNNKKSTINKNTIKENCNTLRYSKILTNNPPIKKNTNTRRLNTSCPENSDYVKPKSIKTDRTFFIIKEEEEYNNKIKNVNINKYIKNQIPFSKKNELNSNSKNKENKDNKDNKDKENSDNLKNPIKFNNIKFPSGKYSKINGINSNSISISTSNNNSKTPDKKLFDTSLRQTSIENNNTQNQKMNTFKVKIFGGGYGNGNVNNNNTITPPKYSNYANYKINSVKNYSQVSKDKDKEKENSKIKDSSLNSTLKTLNSTWVKSSSVNKNENTNNNTIFNKQNSASMRKKNINISNNNNNMERDFKDMTIKTTRNRPREKIDISPLKIPIDKKPYIINNNNNKAKNININFYQNIIINNSNKKTTNNNSSINNSMNKEEVEKINFNVTKESYYLKNLLNKQAKGNSTIKKNYSNKNTTNSNSNNKNIKNERTSSIGIESKYSEKSKISINGNGNGNSRIRSTSISQSLSDKSSNPLMNNSIIESTGAINQNCIFLKFPLKLREDTIKTLSYLKINYKPSINNNYSFICNKFKSNFLLEILKLEETENKMLIKFHKIDGSQEDFISIKNRILETIRNNN